MGLNIASTVLTIAGSIAKSKGLLCFVAGTGVLAVGLNGELQVKAIENIKVGDVVVSYNEITGKIENKLVTQTFASSHTQLVNVTTANGQTISSSIGHPYYTQRGWIAAENLRAGDVLQLVNGEFVVVELVQHEILEKPQTLYNFEVEGNHNYYVAESVGTDATNFVLVHNEGCRNPNGKKGGPAHQKTIESEVARYEDLGYKVETEVRVDIDNGFKSKRFVDLVATDASGNSIYVQVGKVKANGFPVGREQDAIKDLFGQLGKIILEFVPYN
jgi:intein/homing endonuclease